MKSVFLILLFLIGAAQGADEPPVRAEILSDVSSIEPGTRFHVGVFIRMDEGWHVYWRNPGDSGAPTAMELTRSEFLVAWPVQFPLPQRVEHPGNIVNYEYHKEVMLIVPVDAPKTLDSHAVKITADVKWLMCTQEQCVPGKAKLEMTIPVGKRFEANRERFDAWFAKMPERRGLEDARLVDGKIAEQLDQTVDWKDAPADVRWYPYDSSETPPKLTTTGKQTRVEFAPSIPNHGGVLVGVDPAGRQRGFVLTK